MGDTEPPSQEEIPEIRNQYTKDTIFYTDPIEVAEYFYFVRLEYVKVLQTK